MKKFCIASLTHNSPEKARALYLCYHNLWMHTNFSGSIDVKLFINQSNPDIDKSLEKLEKEFGESSGKEKYFNFDVYESEVNLGCSYGINRINEMTFDYEYVLFLEADWILLPENEEWLNECLSCLDEYPNVDFIYLRMFESSYKVRHHGSHWALLNLNQNKFRFIDSPIYTNNPIIRRNARFFEEKVLPLPEIVNETKESEHWGDAENSNEDSCRSMVAYYYKFGVFVHYDYDGYFDDEGNFLRTPIKCPYSDKCKFGFIHSIEQGFCCLCEETDSIIDVDEKYIKFMDNLDKIGYDIQFVEKPKDEPQE